MKFQKRMLFQYNPAPVAARTFIIVYFFLEDFTSYRQNKQAKSLKADFFWNLIRKIFNLLKFRLLFF